jgi:hypothetical protein
MGSPQIRRPAHAELARPQVAQIVGVGIPEAAFLGCLGKMNRMSILSLFTVDIPKPINGPGTIFLSLSCRARQARMYLETSARYYPEAPGSGFNEAGNYSSRKKADLAAVPEARDLASRRARAYR